LKLGVRKLDQPKRIQNIDRTPNQAGELTDFCNLQLVLGGQEKIRQFYVTNLGKDRIILGYPWLREFDPPLNLKEGKLKEGQVLLETLTRKWALLKQQRMFLHALQAKRWAELEDKIIIAKTNFMQEWAISTHKDIPTREILDKY
jgi:hypothetical protein